MRYPFIDIRQPRATVAMFGLTLYPYTDHFPTKMHGHDFLELVVVTHGQAAHLWEGTSYPIHEGKRAKICL